MTPSDPWNASGSAAAETPADVPEDTKVDKPAPGPVAAFFALVRELALVLVIALGLSLLIKTFLVQAFFIPSPSMENTLLTGDRVLVSKLTPGPFDLHRGDIVVFQDPGGWLGDSTAVPAGRVHQALSFVGLVPSNSDDHLIKRVIGLPGDTVACCDDQGRVTVNGVPIDEPYLYPGDEPSEKTFSVTVPAGHIWVLGDHRSVSQDSRYHPDINNGMVPEDNIVGRAFVNVWPLDRFSLLRNPSSTFVNVPAP
ncbi:signal peptidase I [Kineosporia mesophila]|uniref:signal peptidase I n=1 Tax=Kineosporia mesophila TaxID=566012 RepID=UPI001E3E75FF|nr:signal peptidase I [Kineosporia mesophila]